MDALISDLVVQFERGRLSRRDLVAGLSALAAVGGSAGAARAQDAPAPPPLKATGIDHVSILTADLERSQEFYGRVFGLAPVSVDEENKIVRLGPEGAPPGVGSVIVSLRQEPPAGMVDHWAFRIEDFDAESATASLEAHGLSPERNLEYGFYVRDPDGVVVQMV